ncbi:hypothetical protein J6590_065284 [Homalodisca vitripennis]|nr:hypothetical protein J6590_065284 [Homalodisca vitripennis]
MTVGVGEPTCKRTRRDNKGSLPFFLGDITEINVSNTSSWPNSLSRCATPTRDSPFPDESIRSTIIGVSAIYVILVLRHFHRISFATKPACYIGFHRHPVYTLESCPSSKQFFDCDVSHVTSRLSLRIEIKQYGNQWSSEDPNKRRGVPLPLRTISTSRHEEETQVEPRNLANSHSRSPRLMEDPPVARMPRSQEESPAASIERNVKVILTKIVAQLIEGGSALQRGSRCLRLIHQLQDSHKRQTPALCLLYRRCQKTGRRARAPLSEASQPEGPLDLQTRSLHYTRRYSKFCQ